jgi:RNA polymerase sigma factor (sigma-70 family)
MRDAPSTRHSLLVRLRDTRDEVAWEEFVEIYEPLIHRLARHSGLQGADAEDLAQEVFRAVASAIGRWDPDPGRGSFRGWLFRVVRNLIINLLESRKRNPRGSGDEKVEELLRQQPAPDASATVLFEEEYGRQLFRWAIGRVRGEFGESTWQAFWRTAVEGQKPADVADALGVRVGSVYVYRNRVTSRLRSVIAAVEGGVAPGPSRKELEE